MTLLSVIERSKTEKELWRYTSLKALEGVSYAPAVFVEGAAEESFLVFVNGFLDLKASSGRGFCTQDGDGYRLRLCGEDVGDQPLRLKFVTTEVKTPTTGTTHFFIDIEPGAEIVLIEEHEAVSLFAHEVEVDIRLGIGAKVTHGKLLKGALGTTHLARTQVVVAQESSYNRFTLMLDGGLAREEININGDGRAAQIALQGVVLARRTAHSDITTRVAHRFPEGTSRQDYKFVLGGKARGVFQGKVAVASQAQKTDAHQSSRALLLSDQAEMDGKPELEIYADDVKCGHGCAVGCLDDEALFYLQSRGIPEKEARHLLIRAFVDELIDRVETPVLRDLCAREVEGWLHD